MSSLLNGNFTTKKQVNKPEQSQENETVEAKFKKAALNSIGGSMVYVERTELTWDGDE